MSLVEKALKKIQASRPASAGAPPHPEAGVVGKLVDRPLAARSPAAPSHADFVPSPETCSRLIQVDRDKLRSIGLLPPESQEKQIADQYRAIKRPLIRHAFEPAETTGPSRHLIMTASALPGDGKTFTCINLALSLARERDHSVLLVDADVPKPHISKVFGVENEPGLLDALVNPECAIESLIIPTDVPHLSVLPVGTRTDSATEWLASARMKEIAMRLASLYPRGIVLFDSPPILLTSESRVLSTLVGQVVLVVKAGVTPQQAVKDTVNLLGDHGRVAMVLNQAQLSGVMGYYYGQQYGYGAYAGDAAKND